MRDQHEAALEILDGLRQRVNGLDVQVICRLRNIIASLPGQLQVDRHVSLALLQHA